MLGVRSQTLEMKMDTNETYVTKKEFYSAATHICLIIVFTGIMAKEGGFGRVYIAFWALGLQLYFTYKLLKAKRATSNTVEV